jgi:hypothetical protein
MWPAISSSLGQFARARPQSWLHLGLVQDDVQRQCVQLRDHEASKLGFNPSSELVHSCSGSASNDTCFPDGRPETATAASGIVGWSSPVYVLRTSHKAQPGCMTVAWKALKSSSIRPLRAALCIDGPLCMGCCPNGCMKGRRQP